MYHISLIPANWKHTLLNSMSLGFCCGSQPIWPNYLDVIFSRCIKDNIQVECNVITYEEYNHQNLKF